MMVRHLTLMTSAACLSILTQPSHTLGVGQVASDGLLSHAVVAIRRQEQAVRNIRIYASYRLWGQIGEPSQKKSIWTGPENPINRYVCVALMDGLPHGMFRAEVPVEQTLSRPGGPVPYDAGRFLVAYNGRVGMFLRTAEGTPNDMSPANSARIDGKMPRIRGTIDQATGWCWSIFGFTGDLPFGYHPRFSEYISHGPLPGQKHVQLAARWTRWHGRRYLDVTRVGSPDGKNIFLLDPRAGFSIAECRDYGWRAKMGPTGKLVLVPGQHVRFTFRVYGFSEPTAEIFYPREIDMKTFNFRSGPGKTGHVHEVWSATVNVRKVTVNDPHVTQGTYVIKFPRGTIVENMATGKVIRVSGTPRQQLAAIEKAVKAARKSTAAPNGAVR